MKKLLLALALGTALVTPSFAFADIGPEPWEQTVAPYYESVEQELVTEPVFDHPYRNENTYWAEVRTEPPTETESMLTQFPRALYLTVLIECIVAFVVLGALKLSRRIVLSVPLVSMVTLPLLWLALVPTVGNADALSALVVGEVAVVFVEAALLYALQRPQKMKFKHALIVSLAMNVVSVLVGFALNA
ncbi:MAG: hypothetical protein AAB663_02975 [Patescibacteria group bacterium]